MRSSSALDMVVPVRLRIVRQFCRQLLACGVAELDVECLHHSIGNERECEIGIQHFEGHGPFVLHVAGEIVGSDPPPSGQWTKPL